MKHLIILNDPPYGTERCYNGLRMAHALALGQAIFRQLLHVEAPAWSDAES